MRKNEEDEMEKRQENFNHYEDFVAELYGILLVSIRSTLLRGLGHMAI
jgi:hypothetical protein